jgi:hypothetical protein
MKSKLYLACVLLLSIVLVACGSSSKSAFPTGRFIKAGLGLHGLEFDKDGTYTVFDGPETLVVGTYTANDKIYTETANSTGCKTNISFKYTFDGKNLTFNYVGNPADDADCSGRVQDFNNVTLTLSK